ncbi:MAG TPA: FecR family protein [Gallionella sp.]|nr:FecR family protein [Gallionella sp.]
MFSQQHLFVLCRTTALAMVLAVFPLTGYCVAAGKVEFVAGNVMAVAADGSQRPLVKGAEINAGEAIHTATGARAQVRFTDGGFVSLQPDTQFRVDEYHYENRTDGKEKGLFSLLKGGLRAITGLIGRVNRDNYKVATPLATIGIRGTGYNAVLNEELQVSVAEGVVSLTNKGGVLTLSQGQSALVTDVNTIPKLIFEKPSTPPAGMTGTTTPSPVTEQFVAGACTTCANTGLPSSVTGGLTVITGVAAVGTSIMPAGGLGADYPGTVTFNTAGTEVSYKTAGGTLIDLAAATLDTSTNNGIPAAGYDGTIAWGRFYGAITQGLQILNFNANQGMHTVVGIPTPTLPASGVATYTLAGATRPTLSTGAWTPGVVTGGSMAITFGAVPFIEPSSLVFTMNGSTFTLHFSGSFTGNSFILNNFATTYALTNAPATGAPATPCNPASCMATVGGFIAGGNASRAGIIYGINGGAIPAGAHVDGTAVFSRL